MTTATESLKNTGPTLPDFETCESAEATISYQLTLFAADFLAKMSALPERELGLTESARHFGQSLPESFASLGPDGSWLRTCQGYSQVTMDGSLVEFCETWPRAGMMWNGTVYQQQPLVPLTGGIEYSLWPTPRASAIESRPNQRGGRVLEEEVLIVEGLRHRGEYLPMSQRGNGRLRMTPEFVEWLMGFPDGWTDLDRSETP